MGANTPPLVGCGEGGGGRPAAAREKAQVAELFTGQAAKRKPGAVARARRLRRDMTVVERLLWKELRKRGLNIRRQAPIGPYVADFACHANRLVIEVDSARHDLPGDQLHDATRTAWLETQGYRVIRFRNSEIANDVHAVVAAIVAVLSPEANSDSAVRSPPSPALPPSRGKGEVF